MIVKIDKDTLFPYLMFNQEIKYTKNISLFPVKMKDYILFQTLIPSITIRKNSTFRDKKIIKMSYMDFLFYASIHQDLDIEYNMSQLHNYYAYAIRLFMLCCNTQDVRVDVVTNSLQINGDKITQQMFDDIRRIIIIQNDVDFDVDEFINYDTEQKLIQSQKINDKNADKSDIEDYIDSLVIAMKITEEQVMNMSIRKFWRYIKRYNLHESYTIAKTGECSGMVKFKDPIKHWMTSLDVEDKYEHLKLDEKSLKEKIGNANG